MSEPCTLRAEALEVWRGPNRVLSRLDLVVRPHAVTALLGGNGSGKSTTLYALSGLVPIRSGRLSLLGEDITGRDTRQMLSMGIAHVPQGREVFPTLTVQENLLVGGAMLPRAARRMRVGEVIERFPALQQKLALRAGAMSGGEQQQLAIARALMMSPKVVLMDEPSAGLSPVMVDALIDTIRDVRSLGVAVLLVEQNVGVAAAAADHAYVLKAGEIAMERSAKELFSDRKVLEAYLGR